MFCYISAPPFADLNLAKLGEEMCRPHLLQSDKSATWRQKARIGCREKKGTVSMATAEMRPLASV